MNDAPEEPQDDKANLAAVAESVAEAPDAPAPPVPNAIIVLREFKPDGDVNVKLQLSGDVRITEILTVLKKAIKITEELV